MGLTSHFFLATKADLDALQDRSSPVEMFDGMEDTGVDVVMLCTLEQFTSGNDWEDVFDSRYVMPERELGADGPWVYRVSEQLCDALRSFNTPEIKQYAHLWADTDEWIMADNNGEERLGEVLSQLVNLCRKAKARKQNVYLWAWP